MQWVTRINQACPLMLHGVFDGIGYLQIITPNEIFMILVRLAESSSIRRGFLSITETSQVMTATCEVDFMTPWCKESV